MDGETGSAHARPAHRADRRAAGRTRGRARLAQVARRADRREAERARRADHGATRCSRRRRGGAIGRPHVARALIAGGWVRDQREAFDRYLGAGRPANVEKQRITVADGIRLIHECGGLAVIAHPGADGRRERVEPLVALGLDGLEVRHPGHSARGHAAHRGAGGPFRAREERRLRLARRRERARACSAACTCPRRGSTCRTREWNSGARPPSRERRSRGAWRSSRAPGTALGRAIAVALGADGAHVAVHYHESADAARATVKADRGRRGCRLGLPGGPARCRGRDGARGRRRSRVRPARRARQLRRLDAAHTARHRDAGAVGRRVRAEPARAVLSLARRGARHGRAGRRHREHLGPHGFRIVAGVRAARREQGRRVRR